MPPCPQLLSSCRAAAQEEKLLAEVEAVVEEERQKAALPDGASSAHGVAHAAGRLAQSLAHRGRDSDGGVRAPLLPR
jgi:hypothetical protein